MNDIKELTREVDIILSNPEKFKDFSKFSASRFRMWKNRAKAGKLSLQKKIDIVEDFGDIFVVISLQRLPHATSARKHYHNKQEETDNN